MVIVVADCNVGDFGVGIPRTDDVAVLVGVIGADRVAQSRSDCVDGHVVACGVGASKLSISLKMLNDDIQHVLKIQVGVKHSPEKISEGKFVCISAVGHCQTCADQDVGV